MILINNHYPIYRQKIQQPVELHAESESVLCDCCGILNADPANDNASYCPLCSDSLALIDKHPHLILVIPESSDTLHQLAVIRMQFMNAFESGVERFKDKASIDLLHHFVLVINETPLHYRSVYYIPEMMRQMHYTAPSRRGIYQTFTNFLHEAIRCEELNKAHLYLSLSKVKIDGIMNKGGSS